MPQSRRYKKKKSAGKAILAWIIVLAILAAGGFVFVSVFYEDAKKKLDEMNYPRTYSTYVEKAAKDYDLDPALIYAVIHTESGFDPKAESGVGAKGVMQMMPSSFEWLQEQRGCAGQYTEDDLFDPEICIDYGSYLLKYFYDYYGTERSAIAAYNAGFVVSDWLNDTNYSSDGKNLDSIPYPETENYVDKVESAKEMYIKLYYSQSN
ncbi:MAG TPA: lytic transglycosylase domain-containing protein [Ruminococcus bromii]|nr:lytic transglycosylase domain-containing protein [Ruminococcus bromii]